MNFITYLHCSHHSAAKSITDEHVGHHGEIISLTKEFGREVDFQSETSFIENGEIHII